MTAESQYVATWRQVGFVRVAHGQSQLYQDPVGMLRGEYEWRDASGDDLGEWLVLEQEQLAQRQGAQWVRVAAEQGQSHWYLE